MDNDDRKMIADAFVKQSEQAKELAKKRREDIFFKTCLTISALIVLAAAVRLGIALSTPKDAITYEEYVEKINAKYAEERSNEIESEWNKPTNSPIKADAAALDKISSAVELPSPEENQAVVLEEAPSNETAEEPPVTNATTGHTNSETASTDAPTVSTKAVQEAVPASTENREQQIQEQPSQPEQQPSQGENQAILPAREPESQTKQTESKPTEPKSTHSEMPKDFDVRYVNGEKQVYMLGEWIPHRPGGEGIVLDMGEADGVLVGY